MHRNDAPDVYEVYDAYDAYDVYDVCDVYDAHDIYIYICICIIHDLLFIMHYSFLLWMYYVRYSTFYINICIIIINI